MTKIKLFLHKLCRIFTKTIKYFKITWGTDEDLDSVLLKLKMELEHLVTVYSSENKDVKDLQIVIEHINRYVNIYCNSENEEILNLLFGSKMDLETALKENWHLGKCFRVLSRACKRENVNKTLEIKQDNKSNIDILKELG